MEFWGAGDGLYGADIVGENEVMVIFSSSFSNPSIDFAASETRHSSRLASVSTYLEAPGSLTVLN
ncbi:MAG: hypothetical protein AAFS00_01165, partial [Bacteroidota bacterium]